MAKTKTFPEGPPWGYIHTENGRSWKYVQPGMWKSMGGLGSTGRIAWADVEEKPETIYDLGVEYEVDGGTFVETGRPFRRTKYGRN